MSTEAAASLDTILTAATRGPVRRMVPGRAGAKLAVKLAVRPDTVARRGAGLAAELARIAVGRSRIEAPPRDRRFKDPAWAENPLFRALLQGYLATGRTVDG